MKRRIVVGVALVLFATVSAVADTGVGIIVGNPTGVSVLFGERVALGVAWNFTNYLHVHADLWVAKGLIADPVAWFLGVGAKARFLEPTGPDNPEGTNFGVGVRVPVGAQWYFHSPFELFLEIVPGLALYPGTRFDVDAGLGLRYHF